MKNKQCSFKKCNNPVWANGLCKNHSERPTLKSQRFMYYRPNAIKAFDKAMSIELRKELFVKIWNKRPHVSEISGEKLFGEMSSAWFHHILPKEKFPLADLDEENIIILTMDEHGNVENDMFRYAEINNRREQLLKKYNLI